MILKTEILNQPEFYIAGISLRTSNQNGQSQKDIGTLWTMFMQDNLLQQIDGRASDDIYCVYTDYEYNHTGFYTAVLGCRVKSLTQSHDEFAGITVPAGKYQVYYPEGKFPGNVSHAWQQIWESDIDRRYCTDFDLYNANAKSFETEVKIFLSVN